MEVVQFDQRRNIAEEKHPKKVKWFVQLPLDPLYILFFRELTWISSAR